jgi:hypothetical protein
MFINLNLADMETGYKAFKASLLKSIQIEEDRFAIEREIIVKLAAGLMQKERRSIGRMVSVRYYAIVKYNLCRRRT